jgi:outer membrane receptor protein involved in Fe transport
MLYGLQATFNATDIIKSVHLNAELSFTFTKSSTTFPDIFEIAGNYLTNFTLSPKHFGLLKLSVQPDKNLYIQLTSAWESSWLRILIPVKEVYSDLFKDVDGYYSMDLVANYRIGTNLHSFIKINNILDEKYGTPAYSGMNTPLPYNPQMGRTIQIGLTYALN